MKESGLWHNAVRTEIKIFVYVEKSSLWQTGKKFEGNFAESFSVWS